MKISEEFQERYPKLTKWIEKNLPKVGEKARVWAAFQKYAELTAKKALMAIGSTPTPILHAKVMVGANGEFNGANAPNNIYLAKDICERFEKTDSNDHRMHILVESTILHEMVHWGDWKDGKDQLGEEGKKFEKAAYGRDINRYW